MKTGVNIKEKDSYWIYGPMKANCTIANGTHDLTYSATAVDNNNNNKAVTICDHDGNSKTLSGVGTKTFYVKISKNNIESTGLKSIKLTVDAKR